MLDFEEHQMANDTSAQSKTKPPASSFKKPSDVLTDPKLSKAGKKEALKSLEQDERQMSAAANEGMIGGEPNKLDEVIAAKDTLEQRSADSAYGIVLNDLHAKLKTELTMAERNAIQSAYTALDTLRKMPAVPGGMESSPGVPQPGSEAEIEEEIAREKLDP